MRSLYITIFTIISIGVPYLVSCESTLDALYKLINDVGDAKTSALKSISDQYSKVIQETDEELYQNVVPGLSKVNKDLDEYIQNLESQAKSKGINFTSCIQFIEESLISAPNLTYNANLTSKAIQEKKYIYDKVIYDTYLVGKNNLNLIYNEIFTITNEYYVCEQSSNPQYCNGTLYRKLVQKQEDIPFTYKKESQIININLMQQGMVYRSRTQDYLEEVVKNNRPFLSLLESCVQRLLNIK